MRALRTLFRSLAAYPRLGALAAGAVGACGFQPLALWPLTLIALAWWIDLVAHARTRVRAALLGWLFGLAHFTVGNNWIATAFTYQTEMPKWLGGISVVLLSLYLAVFPALAALGAWLAADGLRRWRKEAREPDAALRGVGWLLAPAWIVSEWMRAWVFTGFAWNPLGVVLLGPYESQGLALTAKWVGTYGLSGLVVLIAALGRHAVRRAPATSGRGRVALAAGSVLAAALLTTLMLAPAAYAPRTEGQRPFTLIQPDFRQETLNRPELYEAQFQRLARLTLPIRPNARRVVFWPESGLPDYLRDGYPDYYYRTETYLGDPKAARERIGWVIGSYSLLLTGGVDVVFDDRDAIAARNSVTALDWRGHILAGYSKAHLVPYGEYLPMRALLEPLGLSRLVAGTLDFWPGPGPRTLNLGTWGKAAIQICYEIVFSGEVVDPAHRPDYIFNPSNDGWFGRWGPPQHLAQARLRALEEGLPVLRSTTTGISAVIDADGRVRQFLPRHTAGRIDGRIPPAHAPTLFARFGNALPLLLAALLFLASPVAIRRIRG